MRDKSRRAARKLIARAIKEYPEGERYPQGPTRPGPQPTEQPSDEHRRDENPKRFAPATARGLIARAIEEYPEGERYPQGPTRPGG